MPRYAVIALCAAAGTLLQIHGPWAESFFFHLIVSAIAGFKTRRWPDGVFVSLIVVALFAAWRYWNGAGLEAMLTILLTAPIFLTVGGIGGAAGSRLSFRPPLGKDRPPFPNAPIEAALCVIASALTLRYAAPAMPKCSLLLFWSGVAAFRARRWTDGLFVPLIASLMLMPVTLYRGGDLVRALNGELFLSPVFLAIGALGGTAGSWIARRWGSTANEPSLNT